MGDAKAQIFEIRSRMLQTRIFIGDAKAQIFEMRSQMPEFPPPRPPTSLNSRPQASNCLTACKSKKESVNSKHKSNQSDKKNAKRAHRQLRKREELANLTKHEARKTR